MMEKETKEMKKKRMEKWWVGGVGGITSECL